MISTQISIKNRQSLECFNVRMGALVTESLMLANGGFVATWVTVSFLGEFASSRVPTGVQWTSTGLQRMSSS